jgi:hypothetical protein
MTCGSAGSGARVAVLARPVLAWLVGFAVIVPAGAHAQGGADTLDPAEFLVRYREAVHKLQSLYRNVRIEGSIRTVFPTPNVTKHGAGRGEPPKAAAGSERIRDNLGFSYIFCDGKERVSRFLHPGSKESLFVSAGDVQFGLAHASPNAPYVLRNLARGGEERNVISVLRTRVRDAPFRPAGVQDFDEWVESPRLKIEKVSRLKDSGKELLRAVLHYHGPGEGDRRVDGYIDLDEAIGLVVRRCELELRWSTPQGPGHVVVAGSVSYAQEAGTPLPTRVAYSIHAVPSQGASQWEYAITRYALELTPPEQFTLAAFGLGDYERSLTQVQSRSAYRTSAVGVAAVLAAFVLFGIGRSIQKRRRAEKKTNPVQRDGGDTVDAG